MSKLFDSLTDRDVQVIDRLVGTLNDSTFDFLELSHGETRLAIGKGALPASSMQLDSLPAHTAQAAKDISSKENTETSTMTSQSAQVIAEPTNYESELGTVVIKSPTVGRFYARPEPTAEPFVSVGTKVEVGDTIGLVEVMKLFNSVPTEVAGTIVKILVEDAALVEYGQVLMVVKLAETD